MIRNSINLLVMKKKNKFSLSAITILFLTVSSLPAQTGSGSAPRYAKFANLDIIDKSKMECIYEYSVTDPDLNETKTYFDILQIGGKGSKYWGYPRFQTDSVCYKMDINKITTQEASKIFGKYNYGSSIKYTIFKNYNKNLIRVFDKVFIDNFEYEDSVKFSWTISKETETVCGYRCHKASTKFRGRTWTAYYAPEIALSDGPWKFSGLPGLILKIEDDKKQHCFTAISIRQAANDIYITKRDYFNTNRERFNTQNKKYHEDPSASIAGSPAAPKDPKTGRESVIPKRKLFYNPLELE